MFEDERRIFLLLVPKTTHLRRTPVSYTHLGVIGTVLFIGLFIFILKVTQAKPVLRLEQLDQQDLQLVSFAPAYNAFVISCLLSCLLYTSRCV